MSHPKIPMQLAFVGTSNWDLYVDEKSRLWSIPKPEINGCESSAYGDKFHIKYLMQTWGFDGKPTEVGLKLLSGLHSIILNPAPVTSSKARLAFAHA